MSRTHPFNVARSMFDVGRSITVIHNTQKAASRNGWGAVQRLADTLPDPQLRGFQRNETFSTAGGKPGKSQAGGFGGRQLI